MNEIIKGLKEARLAKKMSQAELGSKLGLPQSHISKIEKGATDPRLSTLSDMARILGQELVLVPRTMIPAVKALIHGEDEGKPLWSVDEEEL